jgi:hypothetical protein
MTIEDDRQAIADLVRLERFHRDRRRWDEIVMAARGRESIHLIWPADIRVNGDRALCESNAQIDWERLAGEE